jgi:flagellar FliL protein
MADEEDLGLDDNIEDDGGSSKKKGGAGGFLPSLLKWVAIAVGAIILIVVVVVITMNIMNKNGNGTVSVVPASSEYTGKREDLDWYSSIGSIQASTIDTPSASVVFEVVLGYKKDDKAASTEITRRQIQIKNYLRQFISSKQKTELKGKNTQALEEKLSMEIRNYINDNILQDSKIRDVLFLQLSVAE